MSRPGFTPILDRAPGRPLASGRSGASWQAAHQAVSIVARNKHEMILYEYFRSSASYRMRIALNWKGLPYEIRQVHLLKDEQFTPSYRAINPQARVPALVQEDGQALIQSPRHSGMAGGILPRARFPAQGFAGTCPHPRHGGIDRLRHTSAEQLRRDGVFTQDVAAR